MYRTTKMQRKNMERIAAWLKGEPFRENSRDKNPRIPELTVERVLAEWMPDYNPQETGQFFTPVEMGEVLLSYLVIEPGARVLEPCAGIGNLLYHLVDQNCAIDAYELEGECVAVGRKLFPQVNWLADDVFEHFDQIEGQYDYVAANPPFNIRWGTAWARRLCQSGAGRSEHFFMELITRALKPGGQAAVIGPYNLMEKMPKAMRQWFDERMVLEHSTGPLPGEFALTGIKVHGFYFTRLAEPAPQPDNRHKVIYSGCKPAPAAPESDGLSVVLGRDDLYAVLTTVAPVARGSYSLPVLNNTLLTLEADGRLKVQATNLETTITTWTRPVTVGKAGAISVPCQRLMELVKLLPGGAYISLAANEGNKLDLTCQAELSAPGYPQRFDVRSKLTGLGVEEYPLLPEVQGRTLTMLGERLAEMLKQVKHFAAKNETRPVLAGVLFQARGDELTLVATDGFGLALVTDEAQPLEADLIVPLEVLVAVTRHLRRDKPVEIVFSADAILFRLDNVEIAGRLRDGQYPDYRAVIPQVYATQALVYRRELLDALRMAGQFDETLCPVRLSISGNGNGSGQVQANIDNAVLGDFVGSVPAVVSGQPVEMLFNTELLIKGLAALDEEQVLMGCNSADEPLVLEAGRSKQVVMPRRVVSK